MTSQQIDQLVREEPIREANERLRQVYVVGVFGASPADLPPLPTMSARYHFLSGIEQDVGAIGDKLELAGEDRLHDELFRFLNCLMEQMAAESEEVA